MEELLRAVRLAGKCFDIARSTKFPGERAAAISRGIMIAEKACLRLDLFDIPGRDNQQLENALREVDETLGRLLDELRASEGETVYDAKRRAFHAATSAAAERDRATGRRTGPSPDLASIRRAELLDRWPSTGAAINALQARRVLVVPDTDYPGAPRWFAITRGLRNLDEWQLRELADEVCA